jgi:short-subunit dehydrogenase
VRLRPFDLRGAVVVVVGATSGVGRATALAFADHGARLVLVARGGEALTTVSDTCGRRTPVLPVPTDIADPAAVDRLAAAAVERFGRIDVWVEAASTLIVGDLEEHRPEDLQRLVAVNVTGTLHAARVALRTFRRQRHGVLIVVSSLLGLLPNPLAPAYVASKFATRGLALSLQQAVSHRPDIAVCVVLPGPIDTPMFERAANRTGRRLRAIPPAIAPERVAAAIVATARRPRRQTTAGVSSRAVLATHRLAPRLTERLAAEWSARLLVGPEPATAGSEALFDRPQRSAVHGGDRRGRLRRRLGEFLGAMVARRGADR